MPVDKDFSPGLLHTIALLTHPTGSGKTTTAVLDAKRLGGRTLFMAHRDNLVRQARILTTRFSAISPRGSPSGLLPLRNEQIKRTSSTTLPVTTCRNRCIVCWEKGTAEAIQSDAEAIARGEKPMQTLHASLWVKDLKEIDIFNWQEINKDMLALGELERALAVGEGFIRRAVERGEVAPDHKFTIGERTYHYFAKERQEEIRESLGLPKVSDETIKALFLKFVRKMDMASSYKPVFLKAFLSVCDEKGRAKVADVAEAFREFYVNREERGFTVEKPAYEHDGCRQPYS